MQLDQGQKGFSFMKEGPLDMRMDPTNELTAAKIVNEWSEKELGEVLREYGEEVQWRRAASAIVDARRRKPIKTTTELADILSKAIGFRGKKRIHPATLTFQGLRIYINRELEVLEEGLTKAIHLLSPGGRIGVISFHSLEDRIVKNTFRTLAAKRKGSGVVPVLKLLTKKPLVAKQTEMRANPRARSAKLRFAEKI